MIIVDAYFVEAAFETGIVEVGSVGRDLGAEEVAAFCRSRLADDKVPRAVTFLDALPRNAMLKVATNEVRRLLARLPETGSPS